MSANISYEQARGITDEEELVTEHSEFSEEFPDEHSHYPEYRHSEGVYGADVFACDVMGRHYYLNVRTTDAGLLIDVFDRYGDELLATFARTYDELVDFVFANDPGQNELEDLRPDLVVSPSGYTFRECQENGDFVDCQECGNRVNDDYPFANDEDGYLYHEDCINRTKEPALLPYRVGIVYLVNAEDDDHAIAQFHNIAQTDPEIHDVNLIETKESNHV